jgi:hypothetical protein
MDYALGERPLGTSGHRQVRVRSTSTPWVFKQPTIPSRTNMSWVVPTRWHAATRT